MGKEVALLAIYRRHLSSCEHKRKGRQFKRCKCPLWAQGTLEGEAIRKSLGVDSMERAEELVLALRAPKLIERIAAPVVR